MEIALLIRINIVSFFILIMSIPFNAAALGCTEQNFNKGNNLAGKISKPLNSAKNIYYEYCTTDSEHYRDLIAHKVFGAEMPQWEAELLAKDFVATRKKVKKGMSKAIKSKQAYSKAIKWWSRVGDGCNDWGDANNLTKAANMESEIEDFFSKSFYGKESIKNRIKKCLNEYTETIDSINKQ